MQNSWTFESCKASIVDPRETLAYDPHTQLTHLTLLQSLEAQNEHEEVFESDKRYCVTTRDTIVVEVTAMVNAHETCSMAVSFGPQSRYNKRGVKDGCDLRSGICFVVYEALVLSLKVQRDSVHPITRVLIMLDQSWFVKALTAGARACLASPYSMILGHIQKVIYEAARQGLKVKFWIVESCTNTDVDRMAAEALPDDDLASPVEKDDQPDLIHTSPAF